MIINTLSGIRRRAIIVASGPSATGFIPPDNISIIAVNGAIDWVPRADYFFTLDLSSVNRKRLYQKRHGVTYFYAAENNEIHGANYFQTVVYKGEEPSNKLTPEWWLWRWSCMLGLSENKSRIHTGNSAYGALGLAYHLGFTDVALVGVDGTNACRIEGGRPNNLTHLPLLFASALSQIRVVSCGGLNGIPKTNLADWIKLDQEQL